VGPYSVAPSGLTSTNYTIAFVSGTLTITPASLTVTANNATKVYGQANPPLNASYSGFVNGDTAAVLTGAPSVTTTATTASGVGSYPIAVAQGTLAATNYTFVFVNGTVTITPAPLAVTANNATKVYGVANPAFTASYAGFANGETSNSLTGTLIFATTA